MTDIKQVLSLALLLCLTGCDSSQPPLAGSKWAGVMSSPDPRLRKKAAFTLGNIGPSDTAVVPALLAALRDTDANVRCEAVLALLKCGADANPALPTLADLRLHDPDPKVRSYAAKAVERLRES